MGQVYVVSNQDGLFISKHKEWLDGRDTKLLFRCEHKDEAINMVFELSSKDIYLRAEAITVDLDEKKQPVVEVTAPLTLPATNSDDAVVENEPAELDSLQPPPTGAPKLQLVAD